ncbi:MAG: efflux RND transporter periplasmic adaptor subunit, partial [Pirellulales bacterium]|nr:efflux RND transporter periplasmic adaptor subunit [Pirellulales bacterium]
MQASLHTTLCVVPLLFSCVISRSVDAQDEAQLVRVANIEKKVLAASQMNVGTVTPIRTSIIGSAVDGRVLQLLVEEGEAVEANQPVARLRTAILEIQLAGAKAELTQLEQRLAELENGATDEEVLQSQARMLAAEASRKFASWDYKRLSELFDKGQVVTENELQKAQSDAEKEEQLYQLANASHKLLIRGPRPEQIAQAKAQLLAQQESIRGIIEQIDRHTLRAPFNGYITVKHSEIGQWLGKGDPVVEIIQLDKVDVLTHVVTRNIKQLKIGTPVRVEVDGVDSQILTGTVAAVVPQADIQARPF